MPFAVALAAMGVTPGGFGVALDGALGAAPGALGAAAGAGVALTTGAGTELDGTLGLGPADALGRGANASPAPNASSGGADGRHEPGGSGAPRAELGAAAKLMGAA